MVLYRRTITLLIATLFAISLGCFAQTETSQQVGSGQFSGTVTDWETGLPLSSCAIQASPGNLGAAADSLGQFALSLPYGVYSITFRHLGHFPVTRRISLSARHASVDLKIRLKPSVLSMREVTITEEQNEEPPTVQKMEPVDLQRMPTVYSDVLRSIQILPGASANNELSSAYNVRGGNYDENLIYLNGYEIFRPFLLRQGVEESQSLINSDMTDRLNFYGGAFPANFGDKMSSVLEVDYSRDHAPGFGAIFRADLLSQGATVHNHVGKLDWTAGIRYADPNLLVSKLQTTGTYRPSYLDGQLLANYMLPGKSRLELFALSATNSFKLVPKDWEGNFSGVNYTDVRAVYLRYNGKRNYDWRTAVGGLKYEKVFGPHTRVTLAGAYTRSTEQEDTDLSSDIYYNDNAWESGSGYYLKSRLEKNHNRLTLNSLELLPSVHFTKGIHSLAVGADIRAVTVQSRINEFFQEFGDSLLSDSARITLADRKYDLNSYAGYAQDVMTLTPYLRLDLGLRMLHYNYTGENLWSPRGSIHFNATENDILSLSSGFYYQPPFYYELRDLPASAAPLKSQRSIHYVASWEHQYQRGLLLRTEAYYKKLDRLIPYSLDGLRIEYSDKNSATGYAYGADILLRGELTEHLNSWISYGYLSSQEKDAGSATGYRRRLLDQTHTLRLFLQDQMPKHPNIQVHNRMLLGSGYLYHPQVIATDSEGRKVVTTDYSSAKTFPMYFRADVGFSIRWKLGKAGEAILIAEVLNAFNRANVASYSFIPIFPSDPLPTKLPEVLSGRFFNVGMELHFN
jgi:outer membrane receptor protein involved in Fe transport